MIMGIIIYMFPEYFSQTGPVSKTSTARMMHNSKLKALNLKITLYQSDKLIWHIILKNHTKKLSNKCNNHDE